MKYRKKPIIIDAVKLTPDNIRSVYEWIHGSIGPKFDIGQWSNYEDIVTRDGMIIHTLEDGSQGQALHVASMGDYIIRGIRGEFYPCKPDIFELTYEEMPDDSSY